jgi:hypothetical protein
MSKRTLGDHLARDLPPAKRHSPSSSPAPVDRLRPELVTSTSTIQLAQPQLPRRTVTSTSRLGLTKDENILPHADPAARSSLPSDADHRGRSITRTCNAGPKCFRIANVPSSWNKDTLLAALKTVDPFIEDQNPELSLYPCLDSTRTQTALLNWGTCTEYFDCFKRNDFNCVQIKDEILVIDSHFYDLTPLNSPEGEIIAELVLRSPEFSRC